MKILTVPNELLKQKSTPVTTVDKKLLHFIKDLEYTLRVKKNPEGVGLSAPQVGKNIRIFSTYLDKGNERHIETYINPRITKASEKMTLGPNPEKPYLEGCLSIPDIYGAVWRHHRIELEYETIDPGTWELVSQKRKFESFPARVVQHEFDHLEGILFTERSLEAGLKLFKEVDGELEEISVG
jgi:peptide deformylase